MSNPIKISNLLKKYAQKKGIARQVEAAMVCSLFEITLSKINKKASQNCQAIYFQNHILFARCHSATWAQELQFLKYQIIKTINQKFGKKVLTEIITRTV